MVPPLCYKHNDIHSQLINALHFSGALKREFPAPASSAQRLGAAWGSWAGLGACVLGGNVLWAQQQCSECSVAT